MRHIFFLAYLFLLLPLGRSSVALINSNVVFLNRQCSQESNSDYENVYYSIDNNWFHKSLGVVNLDSIENLILQGDTDTYISFFYDLFDNPNLVELDKRLFYSYVMAEWYNYGPANTRLFADIIEYIKQQNTPLSNSLVCFARHYAHQSFEKDPSWYTASQLSLWYAGMYVQSEKDDKKSKRYESIARSFVIPSEQ